MSARSEATNTGLFHVSYEVGAQMPGAPLVALDLLVYTPNRHVTGIAHVTQVTAPPMTSITSMLTGDYTYMATMSSTHILVVATGYPHVSWPHGGGIGPVIPPNFELRMVLEDDWQSGTASFKYSSDGVNWTSIDNVPVKKSGAAGNAADPGTVESAILTPDQVDAAWASGALTIRASGTEDGYRNMRIEVSPAEIAPPIYQVVADQSMAIGMFPYDVSRTFPMDKNPGEITFRMEGGDKKIPVS